MEKKKILFGAGLYGRMALERYGKKNIAFFVDNNSNLWGTNIKGIEIINPDEMKGIYRDYDIVITTKYKINIVEQLKKMNIDDYILFSTDEYRYYPTDELIVNPYKDGMSKYLDDSQERINQKKEDINSEVEELFRNPKLFNHVEIETINRCNGNCVFCPVSRANDVRELKKMSTELFIHIIDQLADINYSGKLALFSNNEPFLDDSIIEKHKYAREKLPQARIHLFTNGTLLTISKFQEIIEYLDELIIDNYHQDLKLIKTCQTIAEYCEVHDELKEKVTIVLRKPQEILSNRGGDAPNRTDEVSYSDAKCVLPFKQLIIRPDGKVSLCCNDPLGKYTLADLNKETLVEAWNNSQFQMVRKALYEGRLRLDRCKYCDVFTTG